MTDVIYDIETYPNIFTLSMELLDAPIRWYYEISDWRNDRDAILQHLLILKQQRSRMIGFNNVGFDYPVIHLLCQSPRVTAADLYAKAQAIIGSQDENRWAHRVKPTDRFVEQIDLFLIHHFDNKARSTSLKVLEFNLKADDVRDLPFAHGTTLTRGQADILRSYNLHDVSMTKAFAGHTSKMIAFREELCRKYPDRDWMNFNDTKIGKVYFEMKLEQAGVPCYDYGPSGRVARQTQRPIIHLANAILPTIRFDEPEFQRVLDWLRAQSITETKGVFKDLTATIHGFTYVFGTGGIHGSVNNRIIESSETHQIVDLDVSSYYPNLAISNRLYPLHLGSSFPDIYKHLYDERKKYPKGSAENAMLKLALNGVYGDSNNRFSIFYDPLFTMSITLNGQLLLCRLAEALMKIAGVQMIQINTDGLTILMPREKHGDVEAVREQWQRDTGLTLEEALYRRMCIRDVNNYIAVYEDGAVKRKGAYEYDMEWHQNHSALVVPKVAEKVLVEGAPIRETVENWPDRYDFMLRVKVPRSSYLQWGEAQVQNTTRYYISKGGQSLWKWMPPLKGKTEWRRIGVESGWTVQVCNSIGDATAPIDFDYYVNEVEKLCLSLA